MIILWLSFAVFLFSLVVLLSSKMLYHELILLIAMSRSSEVAFYNKFMNDDEFAAYAAEVMLSHPERIYSVLDSENEEQILRLISAASKLKSYYITKDL